MNAQKFKEQYLGNFDKYTVQNVCGDCAEFGPRGCKSSYLEAKHGNAGTPSCSDFVKIKDDKIVVELRSSKDSSKVIRKEHTESLKGIRIGSHRPDIVTITHIGKNAKFDDAWYRFADYLLCSVAPGTDISAIRDIANG